MTTQWLNMTRSSRWQQGCDAARAGKPHIPPVRNGGPFDPENISYWNGWCFGNQQVRRETALGVKPDVDALMAKVAEYGAARFCDGKGTADPKLSPEIFEEVRALADGVGERDA